jgi:hypothetical protein
MGALGSIKRALFAGSTNSQYDACPPFFDLFGFTSIQDSRRDTLFLMMRMWRNGRKIAKPYDR